MNKIESTVKLSVPQLFQWVNRPTEFLDNFTARYGDDFSVIFPNNRVYTFVSNPKTLETIFTAHPDTFEVREANQALLPIVGENSLLILDGKIHHRHRKLLLPPFHGERMRLYGRTICELTKQMMKTWKIGDPFNASACIAQLSINIMSRVVFGVTNGKDSKYLLEKLIAYARLTDSPLFDLHLFFPFLQKNLGSWTPWGQFLLLKNEINQLLTSEIEQRRQYPQLARTDILSMLMSVCDEEGQPMSNQELIDELITLLVAGYDTSSTSTTWALYWIYTQPRVLERLLQETSTINDPSDTKAISQLPYLTATIKETLRFYPAILAATPRKVKIPLETANYKFSTGTRIWPNIYSAHHRKDVYPDPKQFKPERFFNQQYSPYEYLPFGGGNRLCIGKAFGQFQMKLVIFTILSCYKLSLANSRPIAPIRHGPGLAPSRDLRLVVTAQRKSYANFSVPA